MRPEWENGQPIEAVDGWTFQVRRIPPFALSTHSLLDLVLRPI